MIKHVKKRNLNTIKKSNRKPAHGATRKIKAVVKKVRSFAWINRLLIMLAVVAVTAVSARAYITLDAIPVENIIVSGKLQHTNIAALEAMVRPALVGGFLNADLERVRIQLQSLPWVHEVNVRRRWPNALEVHVVEQLPIARWGEDGFLNHEGQVFQSLNESEDWSALPLLQGPTGTAVKLMSLYQQMNDILSPQKLLIEKLAVDDRGQMQVDLRGGVVLALGGHDLVGRLQRFVSLYNTELSRQDRDILHVDLRYQNGLAVAYREEENLAGI